MYSATAFNHSYSDSGIFCILASAHPSQLRELVDIIVSEFKNLTSQISRPELERAKTQLQSVLLMNLESRPVMFEDIGRQVLATGSRKEPEYFIQEIAKITADDIHSISTKMLKTKASVAALGDLKQLPSLKEINANLYGKQGFAVLAHHMKSSKHMPNVKARKDNFTLLGTSQTAAQEKSSSTYGLHPMFSSAEISTETRIPRPLIPLIDRVAISEAMLLSFLADKSLPFSFRLIFCN
ncbi:Mitochondrial-processing peptidase subunit alpha [Araneus ventricosus]|uniref:Mitochondrial-processing peptidase subunit alpha n=1 Tax=Araneus ventricosus TaxID=182803 RepID=A0A4Y2URP5_ARAVE|nr:Mitochondrial-processing peptidase subunit alpha [Araneus ventricosus]